MSKSWIVVPTLGNRNQTLSLMIYANLMPTVIVDTSDAGNVSLGRDHYGILHKVVVERDPPNIQRWWNSGIDYAVKNGAKSVVVVNDDVITGRYALRRLAKEIEDGAALSYLFPGRTCKTPITGWCYAINPELIRPCEDYSWWYGDDDLEMRVRDLELPITQVELDVTHVKREQFMTPDLRSYIAQDRALFNTRWGNLAGKRRGVF